MQLQPHFLFNTMNAIMVLVRQQRGAEAEETIARLSDLLRFVLDDAHAMADGAEIAIGRHPFNAGDMGAEFDAPGNFESWSSLGNVAGTTVANGVLSGTAINNGDAQIVNSAFNFDATRVPQIVVRMRASATTAVQIFFATATQPGFAADRVATAIYTGGGAFQTLTFDMAQPGWTGTITDLRIDPVSGVGIGFDIDWIRGPGL